MGIQQKINKALKFIKKECNTIDPFEICDIFGINIVRVDWNKSIPGCMHKLDDSTISIFINKNFSKMSQSIICAHELGHALLHENAGNNFHGGNEIKEYEANLFASYLLLNQFEYDIKFENMNNYILQKIIDELIY